MNNINTTLHFINLQLIRSCVGGSEAASHHMKANYASKTILDQDSLPFWPRILSSTAGRAIVTRISLKVRSYYELSGYPSLTGSLTSHLK